MSFNRNISSIFAIWMSLLCGCGATHLNLAPTVADQIQSLSIVSIIEQDRVQVEVKKSNASGGMFGLVGALVDAGVTSSRQSDAEDLLLKLRAQLQAQNEIFVFRDEFWASLDSLFKESAWPTRFTIERQTSNMTVAELRESVSDDQRDATLVLTTRYFLTPSVTILAIITHADAYRSSATQRIYFGDYTYLSDRIGVDDSLLTKEVAVDTWAAQGAHEFLQDVKEGIAENIKMLRYDLLQRDKSAPPEARWVSIEYEDPFGIKDKKKDKALLLGTLDGRAFLRSKKGNLFSMPERWLNVTDNGKK